MAPARIDFSAQSIVHALEQGRLAPYVRGAAFVSMVIALSVVFVFIKFSGLNHPDAMDQAQIARAVAAGEGFSTKYIRPLAIWQLETSGKTMPEGNFPDFTHQPLPSLVNVPALWLARGAWTMTPLDIVYMGDRIVAAMAILFFLLSAVVFFFIARELFDDSLAYFCLAAMLLTDIFWQFSISGLPQMLLLFLFSIACWLTVKISQQVPVVSRRSALRYLPAIGAVFGLMVLTHGLAVWIFLGWLVYMGILLRRNLAPVLIALAAFLVVISPWMIRNYIVSGNPFGLNIYTVFFPGQEPEMTIMRQSSPDFLAAARGFRSKLREGVLSQASGLFGFLGMNILGAAFFFSLLHRFKSPGASSFRWCVLLMWLGAFAGMALFGVRRDPVSTNQLHIVFLPLFIFFGSAFLFVLWRRLAVEGFLVNKLFSAGLLALVSLPLLATLFFTTPKRIQWPPYVPPFIAVLSKWFDENEILSSDMPWAVAWYANRKTVLIPESPRVLARISDYRVLGGPVRGLYLTPITGNQPLVSQIYRGALREWARLITRPPEVQGFFLQTFTPLPLDGEAIIFTDSERWLRK
jgi:hypothetical protein